MKETKPDYSFPLRFFHNPLIKEQIKFIAKKKECSINQYLTEIILNSIEKTIKSFNLNNISIKYPKDLFNKDTLIKDLKDYFNEYRDMMDMDDKVSLSIVLQELEDNNISIKYPKDLFNKDTLIKNLKDYFNKCRDMVDMDDKISLSIVLQNLEKRFNRIIKEIDFYNINLHTYNQIYIMTLQRITNEFSSAIFNQTLSIYLNQLKQ